MAKGSIKSKKGFTIIEVVLVLAIAGLIFLMVFIALPALQRSQRDTQRRDDYGMLSSAITSYSASNGGRIYKLANATSITQSGGDAANGATLDAKKYLNTTGEDPDGKNYNLKAYTYNAFAAKNIGDPAAQEVFVIVGADCTGAKNGHDYPASNSSSRAFAIYGYLESGSGSYCSASQ